MVDVVTRDTKQVAREVQDQLEHRDVKGLAYVAVAGASGVMLAQTVTRKLLPLVFDGVTQPGTPAELAVAGGIKIGLALVLGAIGASMGGIAMTFLVFMAVGATVFGGADWLSALDEQFDIFDGASASAPHNAHGAAAGQGGGGSGNRNAPPPAGSGGATGLSSVG